MNRIFKYVLEVETFQTVTMPKFAKVISVAEQGGKLCIWAAVDLNNPLVPKEVFIHGTGHELSEDAINAIYSSEESYSKSFIGTVVMGNGLVWHIFA